jgi:nicotinamidase-related amidase
MEQNLQNTALLVMDMQVGILRNLQDAASIITRVSHAIESARKKNLPVIFITVGFRAGAPEINMNNKGFVASRERFIHGNMEEFMTIDPALAPLAGDIRVVKRRVSAFTGSDLEVVLRSLGIVHIVLTGIATSGVVLSTVREAADKDYRITVLSDGCADADEEVHRVLTTKVFLRQSEVITTEEWRNMG